MNAGCSFVSDSIGHMGFVPFTAVEGLYRACLILLAFCSDYIGMVWGICGNGLLLMGHSKALPRARQALQGHYKPRTPRECCESVICSQIPRTP